MKSRQAGKFRNFRSIFGSMKGTLSIPESVDPTDPMWPNWEKDLDKKYRPESELGKAIAMAIEKQTAGKND